MKHLATAALIAVLAAIALYHLQPQSQNLEVETQPTFDYLNINAECTKTLEVECAVDIEKTVTACAKAFETGGTDVIADIKCARDLLSDKKHCWPCICA